jgi:hypothetical protein
MRGALPRSCKSSLSAVADRGRHVGESTPLITRDQRVRHQGDQVGTHPDVALDPMTPALATSSAHHNRSTPPNHARPCAHPREHSGVEPDLASDVVTHATSNGAGRTRPADQVAAGGVSVCLLHSLAGCLLAACARNAPTPLVTSHHPSLRLRPAVVRRQGLPIDAGLT